MAREGALAEALAEVDPIAAKIKPRPEGELNIGLDQSLIALLSNHPPAERRLGSHDHIVSALRFSSNGELLYSGGWDERLKAWLIEGPASAEQTPKNHTADIRSLAYHGGRHLLVSTDKAGLIKLWNVEGETPRCLSTLNENRLAHTGDVPAAALSPDGSRLATGGKDKSIVLWDISKPAQPVQLGKLVNRFHLDEIYRLAYIEKGLYEGALVSADWGGRVGVWQVPDPSDDPERGPDLGFCALGTEGRPVAVFSLAVSPSGRWIAVGDHLGGVRAWDLEQGAGVVELRFPSSKSHRGR